MTQIERLFPSVNNENRKLTLKQIKSNEYQHRDGWKAIGIIRACKAYDLGSVKSINVSTIRRSSIVQHLSNVISTLNGDVRMQK